MSRVLVLGGTAEARALATHLHDVGIAVTTSFAGRVAEPRRPAGDVRIGGFGGSDGLATWLREHHVAAVVDATHPFSWRMSANAAAAAAVTGTLLLRVERPPWEAVPGDRWTRVPGFPEAAAHSAGFGRVLLALGRQELAHFAGVTATWFLLRSVMEPGPPLPPRHAIVLSRGPFTVAAEVALIDEHRIDLVVARDSGGDATSAKLTAARERGLPVVLVERPPAPDGVRTVTTVGEAARWVRTLMSRVDANA